MTASPASLVVSPSAPPATQSEIWSALVTHLRQWFCSPDIEALEIVLAAAAAHYLLGSDPVWPMVVGPSGTGKTSIVINALQSLDNTRVMGDLTPRTFLSGHEKGKSFLHTLGSGSGSGILLFKDFGTVMSKRDNDRFEIIGQLREIHDGHYAKDGGTGNIPPWRGKVTLVAASTPNFDRAWGVVAELGERFVIVRWRCLDPTGLAQAARRQLGHEADIRSTSQRLVRQFAHGHIKSVPPPCPEELCDAVERLAVLTARLRCRVIRDSHGKREIIEVPEHEGPGRLMKAMDLVIRFHAALLDRPVELADVRLARRIAFDSMPPSRNRIMRAIPPNEDVSWADVVKATKMPGSTVTWVAEELAALGIIERHEEAEVSYNFTDDITTLLKNL